MILPNMHMWLKCGNFPYIFLLCKHEISQVHSNGWSNYYIVG